MHQLAPMWWTWMYLMFINSLLISTITVFSLNLPQTNKKRNQMLPPTKPWKW